MLTEELGLISLYHPTSLDIGRPSRVPPKVALTLGGYLRSDPHNG